MNPYTEIKRITEELRVIHETTNEGPRLIAEMIEQEFPKSLRVIEDHSGKDSLEEELAEVEDKLKETRSELSEALSRIEDLESDD